MEFNERFERLYTQFTRNEAAFYQVLPEHQFRALDAVANRMGSLSGTPSFSAIAKEARSATAQGITESHARQWLDQVIDLIENRPVGMPGDWTR